MRYDFFMYLSLPDPKNSGRRYKQNDGVALYRFPKKGGFIELHEIDNPSYSHKILRSKNGQILEILVNISTGEALNTATNKLYNIAPNTRELKLLEMFSELD